MPHSPSAHPNPAIPHTPPPHPGVAATASRFFVSMRKSFSPPSSPRRKHSDSPRVAMYSTPEERRAHTTSRVRPSPYLDSRPTIEQIAMGLHVSRTPHLRPAASPLQRHPLSSPPQRRSLSTPLQPPRASPDIYHESSTSSSQHRARQSLPPPPSRSSMKKASPSVSTLTPSPRQPSSSGVSPSTSMESSAVVSPGSSRPLSFLRARMSKFLPGYRPSSLPASLGRASSFTSSASDSTRPGTPRKAVRFSTSVLAIDEQPS